MAFLLRLNRRIGNLYTCHLKKNDRNPRRRLLQILQRILKDALWIFHGFEKGINRWGAYNPLVMNLLWQFLIC